ncbi:hypothetical protein [Amycolatopsis sp. cmx-11-51]|uniref:hypothetical protein n=1 Tax=unclassified Amycolatopsis TaxID=2618356 RepID=UPI0039E313F7
MDPDTSDEHTRGGFTADVVSMEEARQKLLEVKAYFQAKTDRLAALPGALDDAFFRGHAGETGQYQRSYQAFGREWDNQFSRMLVLEQRFVDLINEHGAALKQAIAMYSEADDAARTTLESILGRMP